MVRIDLGEKFTQIHLDHIINTYWETVQHAKKSEKIIFDLHRINWIAVEEITFLFAWIRLLLNQSRKVYIELPDIDKASPEQKRRHASLWNRWKIQSFVSEYEEPTILAHTSFDKYFNISPGHNAAINKMLATDNTRELQDNTFHRILPFNSINIGEFGSPENIDDILEEEIDKLFKIEKQINTLLDRYAVSSIFENRSLSRIITHELFLNVIYHAFPENHNTTRQCYFSVALTHKQDISAIKEKETIKKTAAFVEMTGVSFAEAKEKITPCTDAEAKRIMDWKMVHIISPGIEKEKPQELLDFYRNKKIKPQQDNLVLYKDETYVEFTFMDFGVGIPTTLRTRYQEDLKDPARYQMIIDDISKPAIEPGEDSRILEYAFLLSSSRYPFEESLEIHNAVPRGLYFLVDIVRQYEGMVVARSNKGKVVFDFSTDMANIKDMVRFSADDASLPDFKGTMISIVIPATKQTNVVVRAAQPSFRLAPGQMGYEYCNIAALYRKVLSDPALGYGLPTHYNKLFKELNDKLDSFRKKRCMIYIDFSGFHTKVIDHKLLYYLCTTPKINEYTNAVIINFEDKALAKNVQQAMMKVGQRKKEPFLFRPVPCIFFDREILWLGVSHPDNIPNLNGLLLDGNMIHRAYLVDPELLGGNIFVEDKAGMILSRTPEMDELMSTYQKLFDQAQSEIYTVADSDKMEEDVDRLITANTQKQENALYLTARGYYQTEFVSLYEELYERESARMFAKHLLNKLRNKHSGKLPHFHAILSITVCSQLIALAIEAELKDLRKDGVLEEKFPEVRLVRLASYYSFSQEKQFKSIADHEKVIVVNDVISTGSLIADIHEKMVGKADIIAILSVADTRIPLSEIDPNIEVSSKYYPEWDDSYQL